MSENELFLQTTYFPEEYTAIPQYLSSQALGGLA